MINNAEREAIRVLQVLPNFVVGGAERMMTDLACGLNKSRFEVVVVSLFDPAQTDIERDLSSSAIPIQYLGKRKGFDIRMYRRLRGIIRHFRPQVIHTHLSVLRYLLPISDFRHTPVRIHTVHNLAEHEVDSIGRCIHHLAFRQGVIPISIAKEVSESIRAEYGIGSPRLIPNGIRVGTYANPRLPRSDWRKREGFNIDGILVVSVGRLSPQKNHLLLLQAFAGCSTAVPGLHLLIVGDGPLRKDLTDEAQRLGLADKVHFLGLREDIPEILGAADLFVLSSDWEGNPLSVMEAMAAGRAVIATSVGGAPELVQNGITGVIVPPRDAQALSAAIVQLATDPERRRRMGVLAAQVAKDQFDTSVMVQRYEQLYEEIWATEASASKCVQH